MKPMTWKEFKEAVDKAIVESGNDEDVAIWYIDISFPSEGDFQKEYAGVFFDSVQGMVVQ